MPHKEVQTESTIKIELKTQDRIQTKLNKIKEPTLQDKKMVQQEQRIESTIKIEPKTQDRIQINMDKIKKYIHLDKRTTLLE